MTRRKPPRSLERMADLRPDPANCNGGTERGAGMLEASIRTYGAARSIVVDRRGVVIAGNKTLEAAAAIGLEDLEVVRSDGRRLVVVQRTDLDLLEDVAARELAIADNRSAEVGLAWEPAALLEAQSAGADLGRFFGLEELARVLEGVTLEAPRRVAVTLRCVVAGTRGAESAAIEVLEVLELPADGGE